MMKRRILYVSSIIILYLSIKFEMGPETRHTGNEHDDRPNSETSNYGEDVFDPMHSDLSPQAPAFKKSKPAAHCGKI